MEVLLPVFPSYRSSAAPTFFKVQVASPAGMFTFEDSLPAGVKGIQSEGLCQSGS